MSDNIKSGEEIATVLQNEVMSLVQWATALSDDRFFQSVDQKWSTGEQIEHLRKSSWPLTMVLNKPKFLLRLIVGKPNRPSRSFEEVGAKYRAKLEAITEMPTTRFYPNLDKKKSKKEVLDNYLAISEKLIRIISKWKEEDLDRYIVPHPLLGKVTVREMLFFTVFHTKHHATAINALYGEAS